MSTAMTRTMVKNVDEYIRSFPPKVQTILKKIRQTIKKTAPEAEEVINYGIAGYKYHGILIYFAGFTNHVSIYPAPRTAPAFKKELADYKGGKGTVQFPLDKPIPLSLVKRIVKYRMQQNEEKAGIRKSDSPGKPKTFLTAKPVAAKEAEQVSLWMNKLDKKVKTEINAVRSIITGSSAKLNERIKWNAPSYYYKYDIVTFGPYRNNTILLVFHHPAVVKIKSALLEGNYNDRRLVYFKSKEDAEKNKNELRRIIKEIINVIDKK